MKNIYRIFVFLFVAVQINSLYASEVLREFTDKPIYSEYKYRITALGDFPHILKIGEGDNGMLLHSYKANTESIDILLTDTSRNLYLNSDMKYREGFIARHNIQYIVFYEPEMDGDIHIQLYSKGYIAKITTTFDDLLNAKKDIKFATDIFRALPESEYENTFPVYFNDNGWQVMNIGFTRVLGCHTEKNICFSYRDDIFSSKRDDFEEFNENPDEYMEDKWYHYFIKEGYGRSIIGEKEVAYVTTQYDKVVASEDEYIEFTGEGLDNIDFKKFQEGGTQKLVEEIFKIDREDF